MVSDFLIMSVYMFSSILKSLRFTVEIENARKVDVGTIIPPVIWQTKY